MNTEQFRAGIMQALVMLSTVHSTDPEKERKLRAIEAKQIALLDEVDEIVPEA